MTKLFTKKLGGKKGFTLAELLIVLAIIAVLAAVAIPLYSSQLNNAKLKVDQANARAAASIASTQYLLDPSSVVDNKITVYYNGVNISAETSPDAKSIIVTFETDGRLNSVDLGDAKESKAVWTAVELSAGA